jgi:hypothetical protein
MAKIFLATFPFWVGFWGKLDRLVLGHAKSFQRPCWTNLPMRYLKVDFGKLVEAVGGKCQVEKLKKSAAKQKK